MSISSEHTGSFRGRTSGCYPRGFPRDAHCRHFGIEHGETGNHAFTILEIMVALFIFSIIVTTVFGSFRYVFSTSEALQADTELSEMARDCLNRMAADLQSFYTSLPPVYKPPEFNDDPDDYRIVGDTSDGGGDFGRLRFASLAHIPFRQDPRQGIAEIVYYVMTDDEGQAMIRRGDHLYPFPEDFEENTADPILCEKVIGLKFIYFDHDGDEHERWNSEDNEYDYASPVAIEIELSVGDEETPLVFRSRVALPVNRRPMEKLS